MCEPRTCSRPEKIQSSNFSLKVINPKKRKHSSGWGMRFRYQIAFLKIFQTQRNVGIRLWSESYLTFQPTSSKEADKFRQIKACVLKSTFVICCWCWLTVTSDTCFISYNTLMDTVEAVGWDPLFQECYKHLRSASDSSVNISVVQNEVNFVKVSV